MLNNIHLATFEKIVNYQQVKINNSAKFGALICQRNRNSNWESVSQKILLKQSERNFSFIFYSEKEIRILKYLKHHESEL